jgi:hypothetical protein
VANYKKARYVCTVEADEEGKLAFVLEGGRRFKSPSSAASAVMGGSAANGWKFWSVEGEEPAATTAQAAKERKPSSFKLFKRVPGTGLEEGQYRIWCQACQKSFVTTKAEPEACPEGHRADDPELLTSLD